MSFPRYPKYKPSGVEWLGDVPEHWEVVVIKRFATLQRGHDLTDSERTEGPYAVVTSGGISGYHGAFMTRGPGVVTGRYGSTGRLFYIENDFWPHNTSLYVRDFNGNLPRFVWYSLQTVDFAAHSAKAAVPGIDRNDIHVLPVAVPPKEEQQTIATFLDQETAKIDKLVAEQERLMELLKEKRQAVISHAVTQGLNPKAPTKPSGIEWLGDVPKHWEVKPLKYSITKIEQGWSPQCASEPAAENEWGVLKVGCGNRDRFDPNEQKALPLDVEPLPQYEITAGDILMSRGNTLELVGSATFVDQVRPRLLLCDLLYRFRAKPDRAESEFLVLSLRSPNVRFQIERDATGTSSSMKKIGQGIIREFVIALPPRDEQLAIIKFIKIETAKFDTLTAEAQRAIDLLQERRTALISAAVTGQIDVRAGAVA